MDKKKVLFVDDEEDFLNIVGRRIESWGFEVIYASDGKQALNELKNNKPDVIILDYKMPNMDGISTLRRIREIDMRIPVIMLTAFQDERSVKGTKEYGVSAFIPKLSLHSDAVEVLKSALNMSIKK